MYSEEKGRYDRISTEDLLSEVVSKEVSIRRDRTIEPPLVLEIVRLMRSLIGNLQYERKRFNIIAIRMIQDPRFKEEIERRLEGIDF